MLWIALWIVTAAAAALLFLSMWIVLPPLNSALYPLAVGSPEVAPVLFAAGILLLMQIVDVRTALYWISQEAQAFGGDTTRIVVAGQSAGAQLAMRLAYQEGPSSIRGVVNYYGPVDLAEGWRRPPQPDPLNVRAILEMFIGGTPDQKPEHYRHASPITWVSKASAPTLSIYGSRDHIVEARFGRMLDAALKKAGATSVLLELPWSEHSFDAVPNGMARRIALSYTDRFIAWAVNR